MGKKFDANLCKVNLKLAINRLKLQKSKRENGNKNHKHEIAQLLETGKEESARIKVEGVIREDFIIEAFEILELFCELLLARLGPLEISKECPNDLKEAVCTIIYAAPRIDIKELLVVRQQLLLKYGREFVMEATSNRDNCVNARVVHKLSVQMPETYVVFQYLNEIAKYYDVNWKAELSSDPNDSISNNVSSISLGSNSEINLSFPEPPKSIGYSSGSTLFGETFGGVSTFPPSAGLPTGSTFPAFPDFPTFPGNSNCPPPVNSNAFPSGPNAFPGGPNAFPSGPNAFPGGPNAFPSGPNAFTGTSNSTSNFTSNSTSSVTFPDFPSPPPQNGTDSSQHTNTLNLPDFPSPPQSSFPSPHISKFPSPPSNNNNQNSVVSLDFPSPPNDEENNDSEAPDFDELTARFERLKKKNDH